MDMDVQVRQATVADTERLQQFFRRVYKAPLGRGHHICAEANHLLWHFANPFRCSGPETLSAFLAEQGDTVVGFFGSIPLEFFLNGKVRHVGWLTNWITDEAFRNRGIGSRLIERLSTYDLNIVSGYFTDASYPMYLRRGWREVQKLERLIAIVDAEKSSELLSTLYPSRDLTAARNLLSAASISSLAMGTGASITWGGALDESAWDRDWINMRERFGATTNRTFPYLKWRFFEHPFPELVKYHVGMVRTLSGVVGGLVVMRIERADTFSIARVVDVVSRLECDEELVEGVLAFARTQSCAMADVYLTHRGYREVFSQKGFHSEAEEVFDIIPMLFHPLAGRPRGPIEMQTVLIKTEKEPLPEGPLWHLTKADGDRDRAY